MKCPPSARVDNFSIRTANQGLLMGGRMGTRQTPPRRAQTASRDGRLTFTGYCHDQHCRVYGLLKGGRGGVVYCAMVVQWYCHRVGFAVGGGQ